MAQLVLWVWGNLNRKCKVLLYNCKWTWVACVLCKLMPVASLTDLHQCIPTYARTFKKHRQPTFIIKSVYEDYPCFTNRSPPRLYKSYYMVGIPADQNGGPHAISEILHIEYRIVCCIETYCIHIYYMSKCSKCNWNRYIEGFCMWNVHFHINWLSPNIAYVILTSWPLMAIYFLLSNYWLFSVQFSYI